MDSAAIAPSRATLLRFARWVCALGVATVVAAGSWLAIIEEGHGGHILGSTWTSHDFPDGLGHALGATDNVARRGLWGTLVIALLVVGLFAAIERFLPGRSWHKGFAFAPIIFLLWGLVFCPLVDAKQFLNADAEFAYLPSGLFGTNSAAGTSLSAIVASLVTALALARVLQLVRSPEWWQPRAHDDMFIVDRGGGSLLELPEEGSDHRGERSG